MKDIIYKRDSLYIVFEFLDYDLKKYLKTLAKPPSKEQVKSFVYQIIKGIDYCHAHRIMHRDLKPQNLLVDKKGNIKLADFGLARAFGLPIKTLTHEVVTLWYRAPEILLCQKSYAPNVDSWSIGCILAELSQKRPLFTGDSEIDQIFKIFKVLGTPNENHWPDALKLKDFKPTFPKWKGIPLSEHTSKNMDPLALDLLAGLVALDPAKRISARMALQHPFFDDVDKSQYEEMDI